MGIGSLGIRVVAYLSGYLLTIPGNFIFGRFNDKAVNSGFLRSIKHGVNTGILAQSSFSQEAMNTFVWSFHPDLKGQKITQDWLYSEAKPVHGWQTIPWLRSVSNTQDISVASHRISRSRLSEGT